MKRLMMLAVAALVAGGAWADTWTDPGTGITWTYNVSDGKASLGVGSASSTAVPTSTKGALTIPSTLGGYFVTSIGYAAFSYCSKLTSVTIPDSVTSIDDYAFDYCSGLTSVTIPNRVTSIGIYAFSGCSGLTNIAVSADNMNYQSVNGLLLSKDGSMLIQGVNGSVTIPDSVMSIGEGAFSGCSGLTSVAIPKSVTSIGEAVFYYCSGLTSVTIPDSVTNIGMNAFTYCSGLTSVTIPDSVMSIGHYAFAGCSGLKSVTIGSGVTSIGSSAFYGCSGLTAVHITDLAAWCGIAFGGIHANPLYYAHNLYLDGSLIEKLTIPNSVTSIGSDAFYYCTNLTSVTIPDSVTSIGNYAFDGCSGLKSVTIGDGVTNIGPNAFYNCSGLTSVTIGNSVTNIAAYAFSRCSGLTNITFAGNAPSVGIGAFAGLASDRCAYVRRDSTGWGVEIPGTWNGIAIDYLPEVEDQYVVIDLSGGTGASSYPVSYLANVPIGGWTDEYKTTKLVLRKIDPGTFMMGGSVEATITKPFYIGVFEVTQRQWELVMGTRPSYFNNTEYYAVRPVECVSYEDIRGSRYGYGWPTSASVDKYSFLWYLQSRSGIAIDLPTEAQWEYSCRAGMTNLYNNGGCTADDLKMLGRYCGNGGSGLDQNCTTATGTAAVGSYLSNAWELYDMHGNVWEWCLDCFDYTLAGGIDPVGPTGVGEDKSRVQRGGGVYDSAENCTSSCREESGPAARNIYSGFRLCCGVPVIPSDVAGADVVLGVDQVVYTGNACEPGIESVTLEGVALVEGVDYLLSYVNNTNAGIATITLTGANFYGGTYTTNFTIRPKPLTQGMVEAIGNHPYTGKGQTPKPTVTDAERGATLSEDVEYTLSYANNTAIGEGIVTVTGMGNYTGSIARAFVIEPSVVSELEERLGGAGKVESDGAGGWIVTLTNDVDRADLPMEIPDNLGNVTIDLNGHDFVGQDGEPAIRIVPGDDDVEPTQLTIINSADGDTVVHGGEGAPAIEVANGTQDGVVVNIGDGVTVEGGGVPAIDGTIGENNGNLVKVEVPVPAVASKEYTGGQLQADISVTERYTVQNDGGINVGSYPVTLTLTDTTNYCWAGGDSNPTSLTFTISQATNAWITEPTMAGWTYGQTPSEPVMGTAKFGMATVAYGASGTTCPADAGSYTATFTVAETANYTGLSKPVQFTIAKATYDMSGATWSAGSFTYDGNPHTVTLSGLPSGVGATCSGDTATAAGNYTAHATLTYDTTNYNAPSIADKSWSIARKSIAGAMVTLGPALVFTGTEQSQAVTGVKVDGLEATYTVSGNTATEAGTYTLTVTGTGNFTGTATAQWQIRPDGIVETMTPYDGIYDGAGHGIEVSVSKPDGAMVKYAYAANGPYAEDAIFFTNVTEEAITVWYTVEASNYTTVTNSGTVKISPKTLTDDMVRVSGAPYTYDGTAKEPAVEVADGTPSVIAESDYDVAYSNNVNAGEATVTVTGKGNYTGVVTKHFDIGKVEVYAPIVASVLYSGDTQMSGIADTELYEVVNNGGVDAGEYPVTITLKDPDNYKWKGSDSASLTMPFIIGKAGNWWIREPSISGWVSGRAPSAPDLGEARFGSVVVTYGESGTMPPVNPGDYTATFTVAGTSNHAGLMKMLPFTITSAEKAKLDDAFDGLPATIEPDGDGGWIVTITNDIDAADLPIEIPDNIGNVTIDLNGHDLVGGDGQPVVQIVAGEGDGEPTQITIVNSGEDATVQGGEGAPAIEVAENAQDGVLINIGEGVTVQGGDDYTPAIIGEIGTNEGSIVEPVRIHIPGEGTVTVPKSWKTDQKVTWKAVAAKGSVFAHWEGAFVDSRLLSKNELRNPSLQFAVPAGFDTNGIRAVFLAVDDDRLGQLALSQPGPLAPNVEVAGLSLVDDSESYVTASVSGLPTGLKFDAKTLVITGNPTKPGVYTVKITAKNASGYQWAENIELRVADIEDARIGFGGLPEEGAVGTAYAGQIDAGEFKSLSANGLPAGLKMDAKTGAVAGVPTKGGYYTVTVTANYPDKTKATATRLLTISPVAAVAEPKRTAYHPLTVLSTNTAAGTATGTGVYAAGKKVSISAKPTKGWVFAGWYRDMKLTEPMVFASADGRTASQSVIVPEVRYLFARFVTEAEDATSLKVAVADAVTETDGTYALDLGACVESLSLPKLAVTGLPAGLKYEAKTLTVAGKATKPGVYTVKVAATNTSVKKATDETTATFTITVPNFTCDDVLPGLLSETDAYGAIYAGVALGPDLIDCTPTKDWTVKVAGLPTGLKYDAKTGKITGVPTAKTGAYTVTFTASKKGEANQVATITLNVEALPDWAVGTFDGNVKCKMENGELGDGGQGLAALPCGTVTLTVDAKGKISGKLLEGGQTWTLSAGAYERVEGLDLGKLDQLENLENLETLENPVFYATVIGKSGKLAITNEVTVVAYPSGLAATSPVSGEELIPYGVVSGGEWTAWQNLWKRTDTKAAMPVFKNDIKIDHEFGEPGDTDNKVTLTFKKDGVVAFAGMVGGVKVSGSSQLVSVGRDDLIAPYQITLYAPPKATAKPPFEGWCKTLTVTLTTDAQNVVTDVVVE